jgi:F0F1-type ATP synthase assembly protein I
VDENEKKSNNKGTWWEPAVEIFSQVSGWIAGPVVLALIVGKYLDGRFGTKPWIFLGLTGIAFIVSTFGIVKVVGKYMAKITEESKQEKNDNTRN